MKYQFAYMNITFGYSIIYMGFIWVVDGAISALIKCVIPKLFFFVTGYALYANTVGQKFFWGIFSVSK